MPQPIFINGRFITQPLSGVQRFATEITAALSRQEPGRVTILRPPGVAVAKADERVVGSRSGQTWEQFELPRHVSAGVLVNLGNTAPLWLRTQVVVIHDAGVFATPGAYTARFRLWYKFLQAQLVNRGASLVAVSEFGRRELARWLGIDPRAVGLVSEGADHMHAIIADRAVLNMLPSERFVLAVGNLSTHKNLAALSALASRLAQRGVTLVITGAAVVGGFNVKGRHALPQPAHYLGRVSDAELKALYEAAECLVFPSLYEGFGLPAVEAMACGCPVAVSGIPALQETCGEAALYFNPTAPAEIADQVCRLLDDSALSTAQRAAALVRVEAFTWERAAAQLSAVIEHCANI